MIANAYAAVMNPEVNPLRQLPKTVRFQIMTSLALMWSIVFALWTGMIMWVGPSMLVHAILLIGVYFTGDAFRRAGKQNFANHRAKYIDPVDGCSRYDDIWGG
tara:strand:+ start:44 stop:352 length:309 start_codon:yes stop_codon:yes gene_type:complete